jgi:hypothetical protein
MSGELKALLLQAPPVDHRMSFDGMCMSCPCLFCPSPAPPTRSCLHRLGGLLRGDRRSSRIEVHAALILGFIEQKSDIILAASRTGATNATLRRVSRRWVRHNVRH